MSKFGRIELIFDLLMALIEVLNQLFYLVILTLVANGYKILHPKFQCKSYTKNIIITFFILLTSLALRYSNFYMMIIMIVEIIALVVLLKMDISNTITSIDVSAPVDRQYMLSINFKRKYYKVFLWYIYVYWTLEAIVLSLIPFLLLYHEWIFTLLHQILNIVSMSFLFITLNYSMIEQKDGSYLDIVQVPLPFDPNKDP